MKHLSLIERYRFLFLFVVMLCFFIFKSLGAQLQYQGVTGYFFLVLITYSLYVISNKKDLLIAVVIFVGIAECVLFVVDDFLDSNSLLALKIFFAILFFALMTYACLKTVVKAKKINVTALFGSLCAYFFIGLFWAYLFYFLLVLDGGAFSGVVLNKHAENEMIYYSFVTLTTLGYGDVVPVSSIAKTLSWLEAYFGQAYLTLLMAQLVGRYIISSQHQE